MFMHIYIYIYIYIGEGRRGEGDKCCWTPSLICALGYMERAHASRFPPTQRGGQEIQRRRKTCVMPGETVSTPHGQYTRVLLAIVFLLKNFIPQPAAPRALGPGGWHPWRAPSRSALPRLPCGAEPGVREFASRQHDASDAYHAGPSALTPQGGLDYSPRTRSGSTASVTRCGCTRGGARLGHRHPSRHRHPCPARSGTVQFCTLCDMFARDEHLASKAHDKKELIIINILILLLLLLQQQLLLLLLIMITITMLLLLLLLLLMMIIIIIPMLAITNNINNTTTINHTIT